MLNTNAFQTFTVTINKQPAQLSGIYINEGITCDKNIQKRAIFISRIVFQEAEKLLSSSTDNQLSGNSNSLAQYPLNSLQSGDQILSVNGLDLQTYPSLDEIVSFMSKASSLTLKLGRWTNSRIMNQENFCIDSSRENVECHSYWSNDEKKSLSVASNQCKQSYNNVKSLFSSKEKKPIVSEKKSTSKIRFDKGNSSGESVNQLPYHKVLMKRSQIDPSYEAPSFINRNLDIRRLQLEQPLVDDSNDSGLSSENSLNSRELFFPRYNDLLNNACIPGIYQKPYIPQRKLQHYNEQMMCGYVAQPLYDSPHKFDPRGLPKYYVNPTNQFYGTQNQVFGVMNRENNFQPHPMYNQYFSRKLTCSNSALSSVSKEDKSTQCNPADSVNIPLSNHFYKRFPLDYNSDSEVAAYEISNDYQFNTTEKCNSMNRASSLRTSNACHKGSLQPNRNSATDETLSDLHSKKPVKKDNDVYRSSSVSKSPNLLKQSKDFSAYFNNENDRKLKNEDLFQGDILQNSKSSHPNCKSDQLTNNINNNNNAQNSQTVTDSKFPHGQSSSNSNTGLQLMDKYLPEEGKDFRLLQSERWMKPLRISDQSFGIAGILVVNVIAGCSLQSSHSLFRDLYCVLEIDSIRKARSMIRTSTEIFEWDEIFEIDLWNSHFISILLYQWDPKTHHRLCFYGGINLVSFVEYFQQNVAGADKVILQLVPKGLLYLEMAYLNWELSLIRQSNPRENSVFGRPINQIRSAVSSNGSSDFRPFVLTLCIEEIERRGLDNIGLYRLCGAAKLKAHLRQLLETYLELTDISNAIIPDIHVITSVLKDFLRELPEPLFTANVYKSLIQSSFHSDTYNNGDGPLMITTIFNSLPQINRDSLIFLIDHLIRVAQKNDINKMTMSELSTIFASLLLQPSCEQLHSYQDMVDLSKKEITFFEYLLSKWSNIKQKIVFGKSGSTQKKMIPTPNNNNNNNINTNSINDSSCSKAIQTSDNSQSGKCMKMNYNSSTPKKSVSTSQTHQNKSILRNSSSRVGSFDSRSLHETASDEVL